MGGIPKIMTKYEMGTGPRGNKFTGRTRLVYTEGLIYFGSACTNFSQDAVVIHALATGGVSCGNGQFAVVDREIVPGVKNGT